MVDLIRSGDRANARFNLGQVKSRINQINETLQSFQNPQRLRGFNRNQLVKQRLEQKRLQKLQTRLQKEQQRLGFLSKLRTPEEFEEERISLIKRAQKALDRGLPTKFLPKDIQGMVRRSRQMRFFPKVKIAEQQPVTNQTIAPQNVTTSRRKRISTAPVFETKDQTALLTTIRKARKRPFSIRIKSPLFGR